MNLESLPTQLEQKACLEVEQYGKLKLDVYCKSTLVDELMDKLCYYIKNLLKIQSEQL